MMLSAEILEGRFLRFLAETFIEAQTLDKFGDASLQFLRFLAETFIEALHKGKFCYQGRANFFAF